MKRVSFTVSICLLTFSLLFAGCNNVKINTASSESESYQNEISQAENSNTINQDRSDSNGNIAEKQPTEPVTEAPTIPPTMETTTRLEDVYLIDSNHYNLKCGGFTDSFGNSSYDNVHYYMGLNKSHWLDDEPWSLHYLNKQYTEFCGTIVLPSKDEIEASFYVHIYADGNQIYSVNDVTKTGGAVDFEIDVSGCEQLEIRVGETSRAGYSDGFDLGIVNTILK